MATHLDPSRWSNASTAKDKVRFLCEFGRMAPSVHNIQPWEFEIHENRLEIFISKSRKLIHGDPTGRETWLSIGCCVENIVIAGNHFGLSTSLHVRDQDGDSGVTLTFKPADPDPSPLLPAIESRNSNRRPFQRKRIPMDEFSLLSQLAGTDVEIRLIDDYHQVNQVAEWAGQAIGMALSNPAFRAELAELILPAGSKKRQGIAGHSLGVNWLRARFTERHLVKHGLNIKDQQDKERQMVGHSAVLACVFTKGDVPKYWLKAGRTYQRLGLTAETLGIAQSTTAALVEAADFHTSVEKLCDTNLRLQAILRLGYATGKTDPSPRLPLSKLIR